MKPTLTLAALLLATACAGPTAPSPSPSPEAASPDPAADCVQVVGAWADETVRMVTDPAPPTPGASMPELADLPEEYQPAARAIEGDVALAAANPGTPTGDEAYDRASRTLLDECDRATGGGL